MPQRYRDGAAVIASFWALRHWLWIDRFDEWHVARYGEHDRGPWWVRLVGRFVSWCDDWRTAVSMRYWRQEADRLRKEESSA